MDQGNYDFFQKYEKKGELFNGQRGKLGGGQSKERGPRVGEGAKPKRGMVVCRGDTGNDRLDRESA